MAARRDNDGEGGEIVRLVDREKDWTANLIQNDDGYIANLANVMIALRDAPIFAGKFSFDEMTRTPMTHFGTPDLTPLTDVTASRVQEYLQIIGLHHVSKTAVYDGILAIAEENRFHPVRASLGGIKWDGIHRAHNWLTYYLGAKESEYTRAIGRMFLISMAARIYRPGCKCDYMLVLEGPQGLMKSSACRILAGEKYFSDSLPDIDKDKDCSVHLRGKWLIEISELSSLSKADNARLKAFITRQEERYRPPYGRAEVHEPRQCVFIGSTNSSAYLRDETGGRRFWPVKCGAIDLDALKRDRDQLLAEAAFMFRRGAHWWPDREFERVHITPQQGARFVVDAWEEPILKWLIGKAETTVFDIATKALCIETGRVGTVEQRRIVAILEENQWFRDGRMPGVGRTRWRRGGET